MSESLIETLEMLLKPNSCPCPYALFRLSCIRNALDQVKSLTKDKFLKVYNYLRKNYEEYDEAVYKEVINETEEHLKKL